LLLARQGFRVALLDQSHFPRHKACAEYLSPGVWETVRRLGLAEVLDAHAPLRVCGMEIISPGDCVLPVRYRSCGQSHHAMTLSRRRLDTSLVRAATASGVELCEGFRVQAPLFEGGSAVGVEGIQGSTRRVIRSRLVVAADGARSSLARRLGLTRAPRWPIRLGLVAHFTGPVRLRGGMGQMHVFPDGYCGVAPLPADSHSNEAGRLNVAMVVREDAVRQERISATHFFDRWIESRPRLRELLTECERADAVRGVGPIGARARRVSLSGMLLVGDAAGFFDPFTGEGIYRAIRGAEIAADVGARALRAGDLSARALSAYDRGRARAFRRKEVVTALVQLFVQYPGLLEYAVPRLAVRHDALDTLGMVLGDMTDAGAFLNPRMLWQALRP
jgi:flavin-dependent dehydrogenase